MNIRYFLIFLIFISVTASAQPSFKCEGDLSTQEELICAPENSELQRLDRNLSDLYQANLVIDERDIRAIQRKWVAGRNECVDVNCLTESYYSQVKLLSDNLWEKRDKFVSCSKDEKAIAYKGILNSLEQQNWSGLGNSYLSSIVFEKASRPGDGSVDLDRNGVVDQIAQISLLQMGKNIANHYNEGLITTLNDCLINIQTIGSFTYAFTGSYGTETMDSFPMSYLSDSIESFDKTSNKMVTEEINRILSKDNFDTENLDLLRTFSHRGCGGGSMTDTFFAYDKKKRDLRKIYSRELECEKLYSQTFYYPLGNP